MKKFSIILLVAITTMLVACGEKNPAEDHPNVPTDKTLAGDWLLDSIHGHIRVYASSTELFDQTFDSIGQRDEIWTLTEDQYLLVQEDTIGTYRYNSLEGELTISSNMLMPTDSIEIMGQKFPMPIQLNEITFRMNFNENKTRAKGQFEKHDAVTIPMGVMSPTINYDIETSAYFRRKE